MTQPKTSPAVRKSAAIIFFLFYLLFLKFKPYSNSGQYMESDSLEYLFFLFFWIFNQTLGMIHEAGHGICYLTRCNQFVTASMGTIFQIGFPLLAFFYYKKREHILGYLIALFFVGFTMTYTAWYISTANEGFYIPASKSFLSIDAYHDFNYILNALGVLKFNSFISFFVGITANLLMIYACFKMFLYSLKNPFSN